MRLLLPVIPYVRHRQRLPQTSDGEYFVIGHSNDSYFSLRTMLSPSPTQLDPGMVNRIMDVKLPPEAYVVAWICTTDLHFMIARACLDDIHESTFNFGTHGPGSVAFTLGEIASNNIVVVLLGTSASGDLRSTYSIRDVLNYFPNIRLRLSVGLGSGVPSIAENIRVGDVVVSAPSKVNKTGLVRYNVVSRMNRAHVAATGCPNRLPNALRVASSKVNKQYAQNSGLILQTLNGILERDLRIRQACSMPEEFCIITSLDTEMSESIQPGTYIPATGFENQISPGDRDPKVHYGPVALGSTTVDSNSLCSQLRSEHGVLCIESELATMADYLPLLVIRGISNLADGDSQLEWQGHAAAVAASYTKDLLSQIVPEQVLAEPPATTFYEHQPLDLDEPSFRVLKLRKGYSGDIDCDIYQVNIEDRENAISYEALSYVWGPGQLTETIMVNGKALYVTFELHMSLQYLRYPDRDRYLWIDAICIDQSNLQERGHQVDQIGRIFSNAENVIFWLGRATDATDLLMELLLELQSEISKQNCKEWEVRDARWLELWSKVQLESGRFDQPLCQMQKDGYRYLLDHAWFTRAWTIQEVAMARSASIYCGGKRVKAWIFSLAASILNIEPKESCQLVMDMFPGPFRKDDIRNKKSNLFTLLSKFNSSHAREPLDKVYGFLGLSSDATNCLQPDYTRTEEALVSDAFSFMFSCRINEVGNLIYPITSLDGFLSSLRFCLQEVVVWTASTWDTGHMKRLLNKYENTDCITERAVLGAINNQECGEKMIDLLLTRSRLLLRIDTAVFQNILESAKPLTPIVNRLLINVEGVIYLNKNAVDLLLAKEDIRMQMIDTFHSQREHRFLLTISGFLEVAIKWADTKEMAKQMICRHADEIFANASLANIIPVYDKRLSKVSPSLFSKALRDSFTDLGIDTVAGTHINPLEATESLIQLDKTVLGITKKLIGDLFRNARYRGDILRFILDSEELREFVVTEQLLEQVMKNSDAGEKLLATIIEHRNADIVITDRLIEAALGCPMHKAGFLSLFVSHFGNEFELTEAVITDAAQDRIVAEAILPILTQKPHGAIKVTSAILEALVRAGEASSVLMGCLLRQNSEALVINAQTIEAAKLGGDSSKIALRTLLGDRMTRFVITESAVISAMADSKGGRIAKLLLELRGEDIIITENITTAAACNQASGRGMLKILQKYRGGEIKITSRVLEAAERAGNGLEMKGFIQDEMQN
jgi:nucleoside phosphorylase